MTRRFRNILKKMRVCFVFVLVCIWGKVNSVLCHLEAGEVTMTCHDKWRLRERFVANQIQQGSDGSNGRPGRAMGRRGGG